MALTPKQQQFVNEYLIDLNATQAAIRAGYSRKTAEQQGARLLGNVKVSIAIAAAQDARKQRTELTQDMVIAGLLGEARNAGKGSSHAARVAAWTQLGKHLGMFKDKIEHSGSTTQTHIYLPQKGSFDAGKPAS